jgi:hypothetical protein
MGTFGMFAFFALLVMFIHRMRAHNNLEETERLPKGGVADSLLNDGPSTPAPEGQSSSSPEKKSKKNKEDKDKKKKSKKEDKEPEDDEFDKV